MDAAARERRAGLYREYRDALARIDRTELSRSNQADAALFAKALEYELWSLAKLEEWAWNPLVYVDTAGSSLYSLLARDFAPLDERLISATSRLEQFERFFAEARSALVPSGVPRVHAETAAQQTRGLATMTDEMIVPHLDTLPDEQRGRLAAAIEAARSAIASQQAWLEQELAPRAAACDCVRVDRPAAAACMTMRGCALRRLRCTAAVRSATPSYA